MGIIPKEAADEICKKGFVENLDIGEIEAGIVKVGHSLVPILRNFQKKCDNGYGEYILSLIHISWWCPRGPGRTIR